MAGGFVYSPRQRAEAQSRESWLKHPITRTVQWQAKKPDILMVGPPKPVIVDALAPACTLHRLNKAQDREVFLAAVADKICGIAATYMVSGINADFMGRCKSVGAAKAVGPP